MSTSNDPSEHPIVTRSDSRVDLPHRTPCSRCAAPLYYVDREVHRDGLCGWCRRLLKIEPIAGSATGC